MVLKSHFDNYGQDPRRIEYAGSNVDGAKVDYKSKYAQSQQAIKDNYANFAVPYYGNIKIQTEPILIMLHVLAQKLVQL